MSTLWIVVGDTTTNGGAVIAGSPFTDVHGKPVARIGDAVVCGLHGPTSIASGDSTLIIDGAPVARHGDKCACGCSLLAVRQMSTSVESAPSFARRADASAVGTATAAVMGAVARAKQEQEEHTAAVGFDGRRTAAGVVDPSKARDAVRDANTALREAGAYRSYDTELEAAHAWRQHVLPVADKHGVEIGALITRDASGQYHLGPAFSNGAYDNVNGLLENGQQVAGTTTAYIHTHPYPGGWVGADRSFAFGEEPDITRSGLLGGTNMGPDVAGDLVSAYSEQLNAYIADSAGLHQFDYRRYVELQRQNAGGVRLGDAFRSLGP